MVPTFIDSINEEEVKNGGLDSKQCKPVILSIEKLPTNLSSKTIVRKETKDNVCYKSQSKYDEKSESPSHKAPLPNNSCQGLLISHTSGERVIISSPHIKIVPDSKSWSHYKSRLRSRTRSQQNSRPLQQYRKLRSQSRSKSRSRSRSRSQSNNRSLQQDHKSPAQLPSQSRSRSRSRSPSNSRSSQQHRRSQAQSPFKSRSRSRSRSPSNIRPSQQHRRSQAQSPSKSRSRSRSRSPSNSRSSQQHHRRRRFLKRLPEFILDCINYYKRGKPGFQDAQNRYNVRRDDDQRYLGEGIYISNKRWEMMQLRKKPSLFLIDLALNLWTEFELSNRALDLSRGIKSIPNRSPVKLIETEKLRLLISLYADYLDHQSIPGNEKVELLLHTTYTLRFKIYKLRDEQKRANGGENINPRKRLRYNVID